MEKHDIMFLQETHINTDELKDKCSLEWGGQSQWSVCYHYASKGTAILFKAGLDIEIKTIDND